YVEGAQKIKRLGVTPIYKAKNLQAEQVYATAKKAEKDLNAGFKKAGAPELFAPFMVQLKDAKPETVQVQTGEKMQWMMYKKNKKVGVARDVIWAGKKPFKAFRTVVRYNNMDYEFIIPAICLNVALKDIKDVPKPPPPPPPPPKKEEPKVAPPPPPPPPKKEEAKAAPPPPPPPAKVEEPKKGFVVVDVGPMVRLDPTWFGLVRGGYQYRFTEKLSLTGLVGVAAKLDGPENDYTGFLGDVVFAFHPARKFWVGAGAGVWITEKETDVDVILQTGFQFNDKPKGPNFGMFFELRSVYDEIGDFMEKGRVGAGLRILF
ncbi:MAG: hypothetical protein AB1585_11085, partial [Thermodesulfobacteriota bacterium]